MGFRFRKSKKILPGTRVNMSKSGVSVSTKLGGGLSYRTQIIGGRKKAMRTGPVTLRAWWIILAIVLILAFAYNKDPEYANTAFACGAVGLLMLVISVITLISRAISALKRNRSEK